MYLWSPGGNQTTPSEMQWNGETLTVFSIWFCWQLHRCLPKTTRGKTKKNVTRRKLLTHISCDSSPFLMHHTLQKGEWWFLQVEKEKKTQNKSAAGCPCDWRSCPEMLWWQWPPVGSTELWPSLACCWTQHPALGCRRLLEIQQVLLGGKTALHWQREKGWASTTRKLNRDSWKPRRQLLQRSLNMVTPAMELLPSSAFSWEILPFTTAPGVDEGKTKGG